MGEWKSVCLSEIAEVFPSNVDKIISKNELPMLLCNYMDVYYERFIRKELPFSAGSVRLAEFKKFQLHRGDVIVTKDSETPNDIGMPAVVVDEMDNLVCGYHLAIIRADQSKNDGIFLMYALQGEKPVRYFNTMCNGLTRYGLTVGALERQQVYMPEDITDQRKIAEILVTVDEAIDKTRDLIEKFTNIKAGMMQDLLTNGIDKSGVVRTPESHEYKDSLLGRIPVEWDCTTIGEVTSKVGSGATPRGGQSVYLNEGVLFIRSQNVTFDGLILEDVAYISDRINSVMRRSQVELYDVLLNITGASIGRCCVYDLGLPANVNQHVCIIRTTLGADYAKFIAYWLSSFGQSQISILMAGGNREGLNFSEIRALKLPLIKKEGELRAVISVLNAQDERLQTERDYLAKLQDIKQGLMQDLLTNTVSVDALV